MLSTRFYLLLFSIISIAISAQCPIPVQEQTRVYSDIISVIQQESEEDLSSGYTFSYTFDQSFNVVPLSGFGKYFIIQSSSRMQIKIVGSKTEEDALSFTVKSGQQSQWKNLKINFITTTRSDIEIGSASIQPDQDSNTQEVFDIVYPIEKDFQSIGLKVKPFLQGFDIQSNDEQTLGVKLDDADVQEKKVQLTFANPNRASLVRSITICIILFNVNTPGVLYVDGIIDQNFVTTKTQLTIPKQGISQLRTYIVGINSFSASVFNQISISSAIDETFTLIIGPINRKQVEFISVSYLVLSIVDCGACQGNPVLYEGICQPDCPFAFNEKNGNCVQIVCPQGQQIGLQNRCVPECSVNQVYQGDQCICSPGFNKVAGQCIQCPEGTFYNQELHTCDNVCGSNAIYENGRCFCNPGYFIINGRCQSCPKGTKYDFDQQKCVSICSTNQIFNGQKCICSEGYHNIDGECQVCPPQTTYNPLFGRCDCADGKQFNQQLQKCVPICTETEQLIDLKCQCKDQFVRIQGVCGKCPQRSFYYPQQQKCFCKFGFKQVNNECKCRNQEQQYNQQTEKCQKICKVNNQAFINGTCQCRQGQIRSQAGVCQLPCGPFAERNQFRQCQCIEGYYKGVSGPCVQIKCPFGYQWNKERRQCRSNCPGYNEFRLENDTCVCVQGFARQLIYNICLPACPNNQIRRGGQCVCSPGNKIIDNQCTQCPRYTQYVNGICLCYNGNRPIDGQCQELSCPNSNFVYDSISKTCKCKGPLSFIRGRCQYIRGCGQNQYWCGTSCKCDYGYTRGASRKCEKSTAVIPMCPAFSTFDVVNYRCVCDQGYFQVRRNVCQMCPMGTYWDGYKCNNYLPITCAMGFIFDGFACIVDVRCPENQTFNSMGQCICKQGYFFINQGCEKCPYGTAFDGISCVSFVDETCDDPYRFFNGIECVCIPDFFEYGNTCVRCPQNTEWNGLCCSIPMMFMGQLNVVNGY